jgi:hypothetical protein
MPRVNETSKVTNRLYAKAQSVFLDWCHARAVRQPAAAAMVGRYLQHIYRTSGPFAAIQHASALGQLYRDNGFQFDTKASPIQRVLAKARRHKKSGQRTTRGPLTEIE